MLLVDDGQSEPMELDTLLDEGVRTDRDGCLSGTYRAERSLSLAGVLLAHHEGDLQADRLEDSMQVDVVLFGEDLGRRHQGGLVTASDGSQDCGGGDRSLARADIALDEAIHRVGAAHIGENLSDHPPLSPGELERKQPGDLVPEGLRYAESNAGLAMRLEALHLHRDLWVQKLFEHEPLACLQAELLALRPMNLAQAPTQGAEHLALEDSRGQRIDEVVEIVRQHRLDGAADPTLLKSLRQGIDRDDPTELVTVFAFLDEFPLGSVDFDSPIRLLDLSIGEDLALDLGQCSPHPGLIEPDEGNDPGSIG